MSPRTRIGAAVGLVVIVATSTTLALTTHSVHRRPVTLASSALGVPFGRSTVSVSLPRSDAADAPAPPTAVPGRRHALVIGINTAPGARTLEGAVTDAVEVRDALYDYGFPRRNVTTLLNGQASRAAILSGLDALARDTPPNGVAVVAIASHSRVYGGQNQLLAADGERVNASEIAARLRPIRAPMWVALMTCYAEGYALPGIVGPNRIATFASPGNQPSYELGDAGSYLIINMVRRAMIEGAAPYSVESSFHWAEDYIRRTRPDRVPIMDDEVPGNLVLGSVDWLKDPSAAPAASHTQAGSSPPPTGGSGGGSSGPVPPPPPTPDPGRYTVQVCGRYNFNCRH